MWKKGFVGVDRVANGFIIGLILVLGFSVAFTVYRINVPAPGPPYGRYSGLETGNFIGTYKSSILPPSSRSMTGLTITVTRWGGKAKIAYSPHDPKVLVGSVIYYNATMKVSCRERGYGDQCDYLDGMKYYEFDLGKLNELVGDYEYLGRKRHMLIFNCDIYYFELGGELSEVSPVYNHSGSELFGHEIWYDRRSGIPVKMLVYSLNDGMRKLIISHEMTSYNLGARQEDVILPLQIVLRECFEITDRTTCAKNNKCKWSGGCVERECMESLAIGPCNELGCYWQNGRCYEDECGSRSYVDECNEKEGCRWIRGTCFEDDLECNELWSECEYTADCCKDSYCLYDFTETGSCYFGNPSDECDDAERRKDYSVRGAVWHRITEGYNEGGVPLDYYENIRDYCIDDKTLVEYWCDSSGKFRSENVLCAATCHEGECIGACKKNGQDCERNDDCCSSLCVREMGKQTCQEMMLCTQDAIYDYSVCQSCCAERDSSSPSFAGGSLCSCSKKTQCFENSDTGFVFFDNIRHGDFCFGDRIKMDFSCTDQGAFSSYILCSNGCFDGRCKPVEDCSKAPQCNTAYGCVKINDTCIKEEDVHPCLLHNHPSYCVNDEACRWDGMSCMPKSYNCSSGFFGHVQEISPSGEWGYFIPGVELRIISEDGLIDETTTSYGAGQFFIELPPMRYRIIVEAAEYIKYNTSIPSINYTYQEFMTVNECQFNTERVYIKRRKS